MSISSEIEPHLFQDSLEKIFSEKNVNEAEQPFKHKFWEQFLKLGIPSQKWEVFRYLKLKNLYTTPYTVAPVCDVAPQTLSPHILPECTDTLIVFVNGIYHPQLSNLIGLPNKVVICSIEEAQKTYGSFLTNQWKKILKEETDPFVSLNCALHDNGIFIYLPPKTVLNSPIQILHVTSVGETPAIISPHIQVFVGANSEMTLASTQTVQSSKGILTNGFVSFSIEDDSHVKYIQSVMDQPSESWFLESVRTTLKRNSTFTSICATNGSAGTRHDYRVQLNGENGDAHLNGLWMLNNKREAHTHILMEHKAPHCQSMQLFKSVLNDTSRSSFEGKIFVESEAQKTDAFQLNNNLLLTDYAQAFSKPNLEIFADDVKASHGSTFGPLSTEELFYLKTRGFSDSQAKNLLVFGFCKEVIDKITIPTLRDQLTHYAKNFLIGA